MRSGSKCLESNRLVTAVVMAAAREYGLNPGEVRYGRVNQCLNARRTVMFVLSRLGMKQREIAEGLGYSPSTVLAAIGYVAWRPKSSPIGERAMRLLEEFS